MSPDDIIQIVILFILLFLSAFFSSAETALTTFNRIRMMTLADEGNKRAARALKVADDSGKMLSAILIGNNVVNLSASSIATSLALRLFGSVGAGIATGILTVLILIFGEISPKTLATIHSEKLAMAYAGIIQSLMTVMTPVINIINFLSLAFLRLLRVDPNKNNDTMTEEELKTIVDVSHESGVIETEEREMIHNVFDFSDALAREIMTPRIDMTFVNINDSYRDILEIYRKDRHTRIPVFEETTDNVVGLLNMKDMLLYEDKGHFAVRNIMREPFFTYERKNTAELFLEMQTKSINLAIVLDEYGITAGMVTMEDLLEEIVGEIHDEYDANEQEPVSKITDTEYVVSGSMNLDDLCDMLDIHLTSDDYDSIGGYFIGKCDHLPKAGEQIMTEEGIRLTVTAVIRNRIKQLRIQLPEPVTEPSD
ncbi:MAG: HlyC/CorC family transporter [Eubacterium sp.]|nr:HlyC/CorC family transporter [Eubacterium sp.]MCI8918756.1 HlyC/CorC family transporter [Eubacterium sp.]